MPGDSSLTILTPPSYTLSPLTSIYQHFPPSQQETLKSAQEDRERLGVELYGIQQQLARQQMLLEKEQDNLMASRTVRDQREATLAQVREMYRGMQEQVKKERQQSE